MKKTTRHLMEFLIFLFLMVSCAESKETKIVIFNENHKTILEDIILGKKYNIKIIEKEKLWIIKNINEEVLLEFVGIARLKMDVTANNIANVNTENYIRKYVKITAENGVEVVNDTENVDLTKETVDMIEIQRLYEALMEYLGKINKNIIIM